MKSEEIYNLFAKEYLDVTGLWSYQSHRITRTNEEHVDVETQIMFNSKRTTKYGSGKGPIDAFINSLNEHIELIDYQQSALNEGADSKAICYVDLQINAGHCIHGVGIDEDIVIAAFKAVLCALNRHHKLA